MRGEGANVTAARKGWRQSCGKGRAERDVQRTKRKRTDALTGGRTNFLFQLDRDVHGGWRRE